MQKKFVPVMITPFNLKARIDLDMVEHLIDFYLEAGVKGFSPTASPPRCTPSAKTSAWN